MKNTQNKDEENDTNVIRAGLCLCPQSLQSQMTEFEANAEPLQVWLNSTEVRVQESSARLHDLSAKKKELSKLQVLWSSCTLD